MGSKAIGRLGSDRPSVCLSFVSLDPSYKPIVPVLLRLYLLAASPTDLIHMILIWRSLAKLLCKRGSA